MERGGVNGLRIRNDVDKNGQEGISHERTDRPERQDPVPQIARQSKRVQENEKREEERRKAVHAEEEPLERSADNTGSGEQTDGDQNGCHAERVRNELRDKGPRGSLAVALFVYGRPPGGFFTFCRRRFALSVFLAVGQLYHRTFLKTALRSEFSNRRE